MAKVIVLHHVVDYDQWLPVFIEPGEVRRGHGVTGHTVTRAAADPNSIVIVNEFATFDGAKAFAQDPSLPDVMARAGGEGPPRSGSSTRRMSRRTENIGIGRQAPQPVARSNSASLTCPGAPPRLRPSTEYGQ